jgi:hypothetical protein
MMMMMMMMISLESTSLGRYNDATKPLIMASTTQHFVELVFNDGDRTDIALFGKIGGDQVGEILL